MVKKKISMDAYDSSGGEHTHLSSPVPCVVTNMDKQHGQDQLTPNDGAGRNIHGKRITYGIGPSSNNIGGLKRKKGDRPSSGEENIDPNISFDHISMDNVGNIMTPSAYPMLPEICSNACQRVKHGSSNNENIHYLWNKPEILSSFLSGQSKEGNYRGRKDETHHTSSKSCLLPSSSGQRIPLRPINNLQNMQLKSHNKIGCDPNLTNVYSSNSSVARTKRKKYIQAKKNTNASPLPGDNHTPDSGVITDETMSASNSNKTPSLPNSSGTYYQDIHFWWRNTDSWHPLRNGTPTQANSYDHSNQSQRASSSTSSIIDEPSNIDSSGVIDRIIRIQCPKVARHSQQLLNAIRNSRIDFDSESIDDGDTTNRSTYDGDGDQQSKHIKSLLYDKGEDEACLDIGDPSFICRHCNAQLWNDERFQKKKDTILAESSICCMKGKIQLPLLKQPPTLLLNLLTGEHTRSKNYKDNIRAYNSMFSFTSMGGKIQNTINDGGGPPQFIIGGQNYHRIGSLIPETGVKPKFSQIYIYDTRNEMSNRIGNFRTLDGGPQFDISLVQDLTKMVDDYNPYAKIYRRVRDMVENNDNRDYCLRLLRHRSKDARIHETQTSFIPLQYPLIIPYGEDGFQENILISEVFENDNNRKRHRVALREFIAFKIQDRCLEYGNIVQSRRLFQQFVVDCYTMIESQRLSFIRANQTTIRCDILNGLQDAVSRGETDPASVGKRVILPSSFTGGARYMFNNCQDAMAVCKRFGYPDLFITTTCNSS